MTRSKLIAVMFALSALLTSCFGGPQLFKQGDGSSGEYTMVASRDGAVVSGAFDPSSSVTQSLAAADDSDIAGSGVSFPPGSLAASTTISIEEGAAIASSGFATALNLGTTMAQSGPSVVISSSLAIDADKGFTVKIPRSAVSLALADENIIVAYKVFRAAENKYYTGVFVSSQLKISTSAIEFETKNFGVYQAATTADPVVKPVEATTTAPILTKREEQTLPEVRWTFGTPTFKATAREVEMSISVTGFDQLVRCSDFIHEDKNAKWLSSSTSTKRDELDKVANGTDLYTYEVKETRAMTIYIRIECEDKTGRREMSPWSKAVSIPKGSLPTPNNNSSVVFNNYGMNTPVETRTLTANTTATVTGTCKAGIPVNVRAENGAMSSNNTQYLNVACSAAGAFSFGVNEMEPAGTCTNDFCLGEIDRGYSFFINQVNINGGDRTVLYKGAPTYITQSNIASLATNGYYILKTDIVLSTPIADFSGVFEGDYHRITGINYTSASGATGGFAHMFSSGSVARVSLINPVVAANPSTGMNNVGLLFGQASCASSCAIEEVVIENGSLTLASGKSGQNYGGIIGISDPELTIARSNVTASINAPSATYVGGIVGSNMSNIFDVYAKVDILAKQKAGGIAGFNSSMIRFARVYNTSGGSIRGNGYAYVGQFGGIAGENTGTIEYSNVVATLTGLSADAKEMGGIAGTASTTSLIHDCIADVYIVSEGNAGGLVGSNSGNVISSVVFATLNKFSTSSNSFGGIAGVNTSSGSTGNLNSVLVRRAQITIDNAGKGPIVGAQAGTGTSDRIGLEGMTCSGVPSLFVSGCSSPTFAMVTTQGSAFYTGSSFDFATAWRMTANGPTLQWLPPN